MTGVRRAMGWPLPLLLASRYLKSSRRDAYVSLLSALAGGGIALGVAALVLVLAGLSGLQHFLRQDVLERTPHLEVELPSGAEVEVARLAIEDAGGIEEVRPIVRGRGWLLLGENALDVRMVGFEGELPAFFPRDPGHLVGALERGVFVSERLATRWALEIGDRLDLASARPMLTPLGQQPRLVSLRLAGTFRGGLVEGQEERLALPLDAARRLFGQRVQRLEVRAGDPFAALDLAEPLRRTLLEAVGEGSVVRTWRDLNRGLFFALDLEKRLMFVSVFLIVPVAALALVTALALLISSKRAEVGMLAAMGATPREVSRAFLVLGASLAAGGLLAGGVLGVGASLVLDHFGLVSPPGDVYFIDHVPFRLLGRDLGAVIGATVAFTGLCTWYGARRAAALRPIEALKGP